jgi:hypothetical protein
MPMPPVAATRNSLGRPDPTVPVPLESENSNEPTPVAEVMARVPRTMEMAPAALFEAPLGTVALLPLAVVE